MKTKIQIDCEGQIICGWLYNATGTASLYPTVLLLHGFPGSDDDVLGLGEGLARHGLNVLTFNYRGTFQSEGWFRDELIPNQAQHDFSGHAEKLADRDVLLMGRWDDQGATIERHVLPCYRKLKDLGSDKMRISAFQADHYFENSGSDIVAVVLEWINALFERQEGDGRVA